MFENELAAERLVRPFPAQVDCGAYWLTRTMSRQDTPACARFAIG
jgi:LysR family transcriptional regulator, regulator of gene expression of beta-lactamase